jgi:hypothetical protein
MKMWDREQLLSELKKRQDKGSWIQWALGESLEQRQEFYLIQDQGRAALDQARQVENETYRLKVYVNKGEGRHGVAEGPLFTRKDLAHQLDELDMKAALGGEQTWTFPKDLQAAKVKPQKIYPPLVEKMEACSFQIYEDLKKSIEKTDSEIFNSAELFVIKQKKRRTLSNGFTSESESSEIYTEVCFSAADKSSKKSEEFMVTKWAAHPEQLNFAEMCEQSAAMAQASLNTQMPASGTFDVILHADVLNTLFHDVLSQMDSRQRYFQLPFIEKGKDFIANFAGSQFSLTLSPERDFCFGSGSYSGTGVPQTPIKLVEENRVLTNLTNSQMSQYLEAEETSVVGSLVVEASQVEEASALQKNRPKVLEILQFSGLFTNPLDLTFSSEIRLARLYDNESGQTVYVKGGNLSGHFPTNFAQVKWGGETVVDNAKDYGAGGSTYVGPEMALITEVSVSS